MSVLKLENIRMCSSIYKGKSQDVIFNQIDQKPIRFNMTFFISGSEFYCIHLFFKRLPKVIHIGISPDVRITGNTSGFVHRIKSTLGVAGHFNTERKTASENTLMEEEIYCAGHIQAKVIK